MTVMSIKILNEQLAESVFEKNLKTNTIDYNPCIMVNLWLKITIIIISFTRDYAWETP